jgi:hypothetical protein
MASPALVQGIQGQPRGPWDWTPMGQASTLGPAMLGIPTQHRHLETWCPKELPGRGGLVFRGFKGVK